MRRVPLFVMCLILILVPSLAFSQAIEETGIKIHGVELAYIIKLILLLLGIFAGVKGTFWMSVKQKAAEFTKEKIKSESVEKLLLNLESCAFKVVENLYEEQVRDLKAAAKDGKLTRSEVTQLTNTAVTRLKGIAGDSIDTLIKTTGMAPSNIDELLAGEIRKASQVNKKMLGNSETPIFRRDIKDTKHSVDKKG